MGLVTNRHSTSRDECSAEVAGLLHIRSTPRKAEVAEWGYDLKTGRGKRDWCATCMLCALLVVCAITVSGLTSSVQLIYVQADVCETREASLSANQALMRNITNYYESRKTASATVNVTATAYYEAKKTYNSLETRYEWPAPYELDEDERQALETEAREGGDDCETVEDCVGGIIGWIGGVVGEDTCVGAEVPCPDIESTDTLVEYDASQSSINLFGNVTTADYNKSLAQSALDQATVAITELVRRINFASSIYVLYLAFLVVVTPPFVVYGARWKHRVVDCLANVNKPMWIAFVVLVWYAHEFFQSIISSSLYNIIWANFLKDPCWADPEFLTNTSVVISNTCKAITSAENLFNQASANYRYYEQVENTWWAAIGDVAPEGPFYGDPETELIQTFPGNCSAWVLLNAIQPSDGSVNWFSLFFHSGALVALLLQVVLAHWFISWFSVLRPLTMHRGRVMVPEASEKDAALYKEVHDFARARSILPFAISTLALVFLLVNLGASSSDRGMWKKVLIAAIVLALFQFVIVPLLIWRPRDESLTSTKPQGHDDYDEDKKEDGGGGTSFPPEGSEELIWDRSFALRSAAVAGECIEKSSFRVEHSLSSVGNGDLRRDSSASFKEARVGIPPRRDVPVKKPPTSSFFDRLGFGTSSSGQPDRLAPSDNMSNRARAIQARHSQTGKKKPDIAKPGRFSSWKSSISESARRMQPIGNGDASAAAEEGHTRAGHMRTEGSLSSALQAATAAIEAAEAVTTAQRTKTRRK